MAKSIVINLVVILVVLSTGTTIISSMNIGNVNVYAQGLMDRLTDRDTVWSPPSDFDELSDICMRQSGGDSEVCNGIFASCESTDLTYEECYAANFVDVNAEGVPSSVVQSANDKIGLSLQSDAYAAQSLYDQLYGPGSGFAESFCAPYCN